MGLSNLDFLRRPPLCAGWRLAALATASLLAVASVAYWQSELLRVAELETQLERERPRKVLRPAMSAAQRIEQERQLRLAGAAARQLNLPMARLIRAVQVPRDLHVALLGLEFNGQGAASDGTAGRTVMAIKISAQARSPEDMYDYLGLLGREALLDSVRLGKHDIDDSAAELPVHFQLEAQWRP